MSTNLENVTGKRCFSEPLEEFSAASIIDERHKKLANLAQESIFVDCRCSLKDMVKDKNFSLITEVIGGRGDIMCAAKIALYLHETLGVDLSKIVLGIPNLPEPPAILQKMGIACAVSLDPRILEGDVVIVGPGIRDDFDPTWFSGKSKFPTLLVHECGPLRKTSERGEVRTALGLGPNSLGILLSKDLLDWSSSPKTSRERFEQLSLLPSYLQEAIVGSSENFKLYFGYAHEQLPMTSFLQAVVLMNTQLEDASDLCFYFMGEEGPRLSSMEIEFLSSQGIGSIEYVSGEMLSQKELTTISENGKKLRIIVGPLDPIDVNTMHKASEYETLATGDQSFAEAVSAGKIPAYEVYMHKNGFFKQFCDLLPVELNHASFYEQGFYFPLSFQFNIEKLASYYVNRRTHSEFKEFSDSAISQMQSKYDFGPNFEKVLYELLSTEKDSIKVDL